MTGRTEEERTRRIGLTSAAALGVGSFLSAIAPLAGPAAGPVVVAALVVTVGALGLSVWAFVRMFRGPVRRRRR